MKYICIATLLSKWPGSSNTNCENSFCWRWQLSFFYYSNFHKVVLFFFFTPLISYSWTFFSFLFAPFFLGTQIYTLHGHPYQLMRVPAIPWRNSFKAYFVKMELQPHVLCAVRWHTTMKFFCSYIFSNEICSLKHEKHFCKGVK